MTRTRVSSLVVLAVIGGVLGALVQLGLAASGRPVLMMPLTLPIALAAIGAIVVALAAPIRRMTRSTATSPIDPFYATRVVALAKASALAGALLAGSAAGMLVYLLTRSAPPGSQTVGSSVAGILGAVVLLVCGLVAESMCRVPPRDDDDEDADGGTPAQVTP